MGEGTVLVRRRSLGDVVLVGAVAAAAPGPVTVLTDPAFVDLARTFRGVDRAIAWPRGAPFGPLLPSLSGSCVVDLEGRREVARLARALAVPYRCWPKGTTARWLRLARLGPGRGSVIGRYAAACATSPITAPWIDPPAAPDAEGVALIPGAAWATKRWPADRFGALGCALEHPTVVLGGPAERALVAQVAAMIPGATAIAEQGFDATLRALRRCRLAVGGDTGLLHLASALGVRTVTLFGPTHPDDGFWDGRGVHLGLALGCRPCALHGRARCPLAHHRCLDALAVRDVTRVARAELRAAASDNPRPTE